MFILILFVKMKVKGLLPSSTCKKCRLQIANVSFEGFFFSCTDKICLHMEIKIKASATHITFELLIFFLDLLGVTLQNSKDPFCFNQTPR